MILIKLLTILLTILFLILLLVRYCYRIKENFECKTIVNNNNPKCPPPYNKEVNFWTHDKKNDVYQCHFKRGNQIYYSPEGCCFDKSKKVVINDKCHQMNIDKVNLKTCLNNSPIPGCGLCTDSNGDGTYMEGTPLGPYDLLNTNCVPGKSQMTNKKVSKNAWFMCKQNPFINIVDL